MSGAKHEWRWQYRLLQLLLSIGASVLGALFVLVGPALLSSLPCGRLRLDPRRNEETTSAGSRSSKEEGSKHGMRGHGESFAPLRSIAAAAMDTLPKQQQEQRQENVEESLWNKYPSLGGWPFAFQATAVPPVKPFLKSSDNKDCDDQDEEDEDENMPAFEAASSPFDDEQPPLPPYRTLLSLFYSSRRTFQFSLARFRSHSGIYGGHFTWILI